MIWQTVWFPGDPAANAAALAQTARAALAADADLLLCPECWLAGYNIPELCGRLAEPRDGPWTTRIAEIARTCGIAIVYGYAERDQVGGETYNAVLAIGPRGDAFGYYRKAHLFGDFGRKLYRPGDHFATTFVLDGWRIGMLICYDVEFPEAVRSVALTGADLIPTALADEYDWVPDVIVPARAVENRVFIAHGNRAGTEGDMCFLGKSWLARPDNSAIVVVGAAEALLIAKIGRETITAAATFPYRSESCLALYSAVTREGG